MNNDTYVVFYPSGEVEVVLSKYLSFKHANKDNLIYVSEGNWFRFSNIWERENSNNIPEEYLLKLTLLGM